MSLPLAGRVLVLTRPDGQSEHLAGLLQASGAAIIRFPVTEILPLSDPQPLRQLATSLPDYQLAFFVSANAIRHTLAVIPRTDWPAQIQLATVGKASAQVLRESGFASVIFPAERQDTEGVLALPAFAAEAVAGKRVLILRGEGGRELLADVLRQRGARVTYAQCYQRRRASIDPGIVTAHRDRLGGIIFSASEAIAHFRELLGEGAAMALLGQTPVFVPHPRIAEAARAAGARQVVLTGAGDEGIVTGILQHAVSPAGG